MKVQFSKFEKMAGLFVLVAISGFVFATVIVAVKQGWFSSRTKFKTVFVHGEGLHPGTLVQMSGLRAGTVTGVHLNEENKIEVTLEVTREFAERIKSDSLARVIRPFIIGDKVVEVTLGSKEASPVKPNMVLSSEETMDIMDLLGGGKLGPYLTTLNELLKNLKIVAEAFTDPRRSQALIGMFDQALPTMLDIREMTQQMTKNKNLRKSMYNIAKLTKEMNTMMPAMAQFSKNLPELGANSSETMKQLADLTRELNTVLPVIAEVAPKLPEASQKGVEALREATIVLRAMQKSFLLRGAVKDVFEEDAEKAKREPAADDKNK